MAADTPVVVFDCGSDSCRGGLSTDSNPSTVFPTLIGWPSNKSFKDVSPDEFCLGTAVVEKHRGDLLSLRHPIEFNCVNDWDSMEKLWCHMYAQLGVGPAELPVLVTEPARNTKINQEKLAQVMFETFEVPALFTMMQASLSLFAAGRSSGIVLHSGHMTSSAVPIKDGLPLAYARQDAPFGGNDVTGYLERMLQGQGHALSKQAARAIKEKHCYVANDFGREFKDFVAKSTHSSASDADISITRDIALGPEALFEPSRMGKEFPGLHQYVHSAITACQLAQDEKIDMYYNIVLSGGNTMFHGFSARLQRELKRWGPFAKVRVLACADRHLSPWAGGAKMAASPGFAEKCITKDDYDEHGPSIVHKKCIYGTSGP